MMPSVNSVRPASRVDGVYQINRDYLLVATTTVDPKSKAQINHQVIVKICQERTAAWRQIHGTIKTHLKKLLDLCQETR